MGPKQSTASLRLQRRPNQRNYANYVHHGSSKTILVNIGETTIPINIPDDSLTCGWLLSEVIRFYQGPRIIVNLSTLSNNEILDHWLTCLENNLHPLKNMEIFQALFAG